MGMNAKGLVTRVLQRYHGDDAQKRVELPARAAVPPDAPPGQYQLVVVGKLLANDGQTVLAATSSTIRQIEIR